MEVKAPGWQGELSEQLSSATADERKAILTRIKQEKYRNGEGRAVDPAGAVIKVVAKNAVPKLADDRPNLIVVGDDLFLTAVGNPTLDYKFQEAFKTRPELNRIGAVFLIQPENYGLGLMYRCDLVGNPSALAPCRLPEAAIAALKSAVEVSAAEFERQMGILRGRDRED